MQHRVTGTSAPPNVFSFVLSWFSELPLLTRSLLAVMVGVHLFRLITGTGFGLVCLSPVLVAQHFQVYRAITSAFVHGGLLHLGFNMLAFVQLSTVMERSGGTLQLAWLISIIMVLEAVLFVLLAYILQWTLFAMATHQCAVGFSGVIFGLIVVETAHDGPGNRSIFGLFSVPSAYYPWVLLILWQLLVPSVSFLGHMSGVLVGQLWVSSYLRLLNVPKTTTQSIEASTFGARCSRLHGFVLTPGGSLPYSSLDQNNSHSSHSFGPNLRQWVQRVWGPAAAGEPHFADGAVSGGVSAAGQSHNQVGVVSSSGGSSVGGAGAGTYASTGAGPSAGSSSKVFVGVGKQLDAGRSAPAPGSIAAAAAAAAEARAQSLRHTAASSSTADKI